MAATMQMHEMSKTYQYRKVMKPMLERKRRARINKCLDELKDLMVATLESEGEHVTRLEKADILELTVSHLQKLRQQRKLGIQNYQSNGLTQAEGFRSGFIYAANEVSRNLAKVPGVNVSFGTQLMTHLGQRLNQLQPPVKVPTPIHHPITVNCGSSASLTSYSPAPSSTYSVPLSPVSNYSQSPQPHSVHDGLLMKPNSQSIAIPNGFIRCHSEQEENVWRPW